MRDSGNIATDTTEHICTFGSAENSGEFLLNLCHADISLRLVIVERKRPFNSRILWILQRLVVTVVLVVWLPKIMGLRLRDVKNLAPFCFTGQFQAKFMTTA